MAIPLPSPPHPPGRALPLKDTTTAGPARNLVLVAEALDGISVTPHSMTITYSRFIVTRPYEVSVVCMTRDDLDRVAERLHLTEHVRTRFVERRTGIWADVAVRAIWSLDDEAVGA